MMRKCHLDTCPVGVATQNPELRQRFTGKAEHVVNFFEFIAQEVREHLAELGFRSIAEAVGHAEVLRTREAVEHWKAKGLDLSPVLDSFRAEGVTDGLRNTTSQDHELEKHFDNRLIPLAAPAIERAEPVRVQERVVNTDRAVGTMLGYTVTNALGTRELPDDTIDVTLTGEAGQSLGAFIPRGITLRLEGDANDYTGKGLSGGRIVVRPPRDAAFTAHENVIAGNVIGYGATSGEMFFNGVVGERFLVRNSGATAVVEGIGDHGCEYMTGGVALVLGETGRNFGAGMSGGVAYVLDLDETDVNRQAHANGDLQLGHLDGNDRELVLELLKRHGEETGSDFAATLLADPQHSLTRFTKVLPRDYSAVLALRNEAEAEGEDPDGDGTWHKILEATRRG